MFMPTLTVIAYFAAAGATAPVIDRVAVIIENHVITDSAVGQEVRLEALQNGSPLEVTPAIKRQAAERLLEQYLIQREMETNRYPPPENTAALKDLDALKKTRFGGSDVRYREALATYGVTESELLEHLNRQETTMSFIEFRFRPAVQVSDAEIQDYYTNQFLPQWQQSHKEAAPTLEAEHDTIEQSVTQSKIDQSLDRWLGDTRTQLRIKFSREAFR